MYNGCVFNCSLMAGILEPLGLQRRYVPHLKGLISAKEDLEAQWRDSTFTFCHAQLKKAILLHKRAIGPLLLLFCVGHISSAFRASLQ